MNRISLFLPVLISLVLFSCSSESSDMSDSMDSSQSNTTNTSETSDQLDNTSSDNNGEIELDGVDPDQVTSTTVKKNENGETVVVAEVDGVVDRVVEVETTDDSPLVKPMVQEEEDDYDFHAYEKLNTFLKKYVSAGGKVNYASIKNNKSELDAIIKEFEANSPGASWSSAQKLTFWINVYNIYTIKLVTDNYPTSSITNINGGKPWDKKFIKLGGKTYTLNNVENDVIRKQFNEPRIHFALNCASASCPVLLNAAYTPSNVYSKLTSQTKRFLNDTGKNKFEKKSAQISKIFEWYKEDFTKGGSTVIDFINKYRTDQLDEKKVNVSYLEYSWSLNH